MAFLRPFFKNQILMLLRNFFASTILRSRMNCTTMSFPFGANTSRTNARNSVSRSADILIIFRKTRTGNCSATAGVKSQAPSLITASIRRSASAAISFFKLLMVLGAKAFCRRRRTEASGLHPG
jgi:hypothetical protein